MSAGGGRKSFLKDWANFHTTAKIFARLIYMYNYVTFCSHILMAKELNIRKLCEYCTLQCTWVKELNGMYVIKRSLLKIIFCLVLYSSMQMFDPSAYIYFRKLKEKGSLEINLIARSELSYRTIRVPNVAGASPYSKRNRDVFCNSQTNITYLCTGLECCLF